jgi:hypothetical protein
LVAQTNGLTVAPLARCRSYKVIVLFFATGPLLPTRSILLCSEE